MAKNHDRKPSSLHYIYGYDRKLGGGVDAPLSICKYLRLCDYLSEALAPVHSTHDLSNLDTVYADITCNSVEDSFPRRLWNSNKVVPWLKRNLRRFDIVELHGIWGLSILKVARTCKSMKVPYLVRPHGSLDSFDLQKKALLKRILGPLLIRPLLSNSEGVVCTASLESERVVTYGAKPKKFVLPLPVPLVDEPTDRVAFRNAHNIPLDAEVVLFLSRVDYKKGLNTLIPALAKLKEKRPKLWFLMAGTGPDDYVRKVHRWIDENDVRHWTTVLGFVSGSGKSNAFAAADIFVLPSLNENFGIVNVEAMHARLPLLISNEVYIHREIEEAGAGIVCEPNCDSVFSKLNWMLGGEFNLKLMGDRGYELVQQCYQPEKATDQLVSLYRKILVSDSSV